jgi:hypothetical protein
MDKQSINAKSNRNALEHKWTSEVDFLKRIFPPNGIPNMERILDTLGGGNLKAVSASYLEVAIILLTASPDSVAHKLGSSLLNCIVEMVEMAIKLKSFGPVVIDTPEGKKLHNYGSHGMLYETLFYTRWLCEGVRSLDVIRLSIENWFKYHQYFGNKRYQLDTMMPLFILAEEYSLADQWYRQLSKAKDHDLVLKNVRNQNHVLYLAAHYHLGNQAILDYLKRGVSYWYYIAADWTQRPLVIMNTKRVVWSYLYGDIITNKKAIQQLLYEMRGF